MKKLLILLILTIFLSCREYPAPFIISKCEKSIYHQGYEYTCIKDRKKIITFASFEKYRVGDTLYLTTIKP